MSKKLTRRVLSTLSALATVLFSLQTTVADPRVVAERLIAAYPEHLARVEAGMLVWRDGTRMPLDDGKGDKPFEAWLADPDLDDIFRFPYAQGDLASPPGKDFDPGRARPLAFYSKMYGDCRRGEVTGHLTDVVWLPKKSGQHLKVTRVNGVDRQLAAISAELDALPSRLDKFLIPAAGTYNCRPIAGTDRPSAHGYGIAIDIAVKPSDYWRWAKSGRDGRPVYRNSIPMEIVRIFERHGFIWGGKWHHFDTMHFEYRPELIAPVPP